MWTIFVLDYDRNGDGVASILGAFDSEEEADKLADLIEDWFADVWVWETPHNDAEEFMEEAKQLRKKVHPDGR